MVVKVVIKKCFNLNIFIYLLCCVINDKDFLGDGC